LLTIVVETFSRQKISAVAPPRRIIAANSDWATVTGGIGVAFVLEWLYGKRPAS